MLYFSPSRNNNFKEVSMGSNCEIVNIFYELDRILTHFYEYFHTIYRSILEFANELLFSLFLSFFPPPSRTNLRVGT
jgi:hypothetical protein